MTSVSSNSPLWTEQLRIRSFDVDFTRRATLASLYRYFLDAAWNHAEALGIGFEHLKTQNRFWVLSRLLLEVKAYPLWGSVITLRTWPRLVKTVFAMRDFEILDNDGARIAAGSSAWIVLDAASKRPQRLNKLAAAMPNLSDHAALGTDPGKLPDLESWDEVFSAAVRYTDIDVNRHVNASQYIGRILDAYPVGFLGHHSARGLEVNYVGETMEGETLSVRTRQTADGVFQHSLTKADGTEVCRARLTWQSRASGEACSVT
ncbi:MAG: acyl-[acyl-carrier-protein] thioesterase [Verrucomicrobiia bacterium]